MLNFFVGEGREGAVELLRDRKADVLVVLPGDRASTVRGHTADLLVVDELGFEQPKTDNSAGGGDEVDFYIFDARRG